MKKSIEDLAKSGKEALLMWKKDRELLIEACIFMKFYTETSIKRDELLARIETRLTEKE